MKKVFIALIALIFIVSISAGYTLTKDNFQNDTIDNSQNKTTNSSIDSLKNSTDTNSNDGLSTKNLGDGKDVHVETTSSSSPSSPSTSDSNSNQNTNTQGTESNQVDQSKVNRITFSITEDDVMGKVPSSEELNSRQGGVRYDLI